ncbi:hypothetical protein [Phenylobacterium sp.]|uniref:hypothetical protein n=1 Tax=Phenylobacterium sp. TaxID=1871053 RepID=UPI002F932C7A
MSLAALALAGVLAACAQAPPPPAAPAAPPPPPAVSLSPRVIEQASAYRAYVTRAGQISPSFPDGASVAESLKTGASYEPQQLIRGAIAYGAVAALQDPAFVAGARKYAVDPTQRRQIAYEIMKDPAYAAGISGASSAAGLVVAALGDDGKRLLDQGNAVKQAAYDVQRASWSKAEVVRRDARLAETKQLSVTPVLGDVNETARLQLAAVGGAPLGLSAQSTANPPYTPVVIRSLAVAALAALGYADDASLEQVMPILGEPMSASCLNMSKLNLYQCLAVAKPHYEDVFCLGQHVLIDTGSCLLKSAGMAPPVDPRAAAIAEAAAARATPYSAPKPASKPTKRR